MTSRATGHTTPAPGLVVVLVEHAPADSFTRSVDPAAFRYARTVARPGESWACVNAAYAVPDRARVTSRGREVCTSLVTFRVDQ